MIRPRKMKRIELTVLGRDVDRVIEYLGKRRIIHLAPTETAENPRSEKSERNASQSVSSALEGLRSSASFLRITLPAEPSDAGRLPTSEDEVLAKKINDRVEVLSQQTTMLVEDNRRMKEALAEARSFSNLNAPFSELDHLSYLALRVGRLDVRKRDELSETLADRAVIVPLGAGDRVLAAASRKGRFALDTELKKAGFAPLEIPDGFVGVPSELIEGLESRITSTEGELERVEDERGALATELSSPIIRLVESFLMASIVEELKSRLQGTKNAYRLEGWVASAEVKVLDTELNRITDGRVALRTYDPDEIETVRLGHEKVPVSLDHGAFVSGFEPVVFSYGAPLYGTIDPTPFVALSFTLLFGLMFGDVGQGFVLFLLGLLTARNRVKFLSGFSKFSTPLVAVGLASMIIGFLDGEVFANEHLLVRPTQIVTGFLTGHPVDRLLKLMPEKGSLDKLFIFFGFTVAVGIVINSVGLIINIINQCSLRHWDKAFFAKTGLAGAFLFWYALFLGLRILLGGSFAWFDGFGLGLPALALFFGPLLWRLIARERPLLEHGLLVFIMEGFVEILESTSSYISNTVSFLRVGAFALSHAVLSFIVFTLSDIVATRAPVGTVFAFIVMLLGNSIIILLEGMIVAIQVVRLQYYEFFSKFFTETGVEFSPFRFRKEVHS